MWLFCDLTIIQDRLDTKLRNLEISNSLLFNKISKIWPHVTFIAFPPQHPLLPPNKNIHLIPFPPFWNGFPVSPSKKNRKKIQASLPAGTPCVFGNSVVNNPAKESPPCPGAPPTPGHQNEGVAPNQKTHGGFHWVPVLWKQYWTDLVGGWTHPSEKYARQIGSFPQIGMKIKNIWNHHPVIMRNILKST